MKIFLYLNFTWNQFLHCKLLLCTVWKLRKFTLILYFFARITLNQHIYFWNFCKLFWRNFSSSDSKSLIIPHCVILWLLKYWFFVKLNRRRILIFSVEGIVNHFLMKVSYVSVQHFLPFYDEKYYVIAEEYFLMFIICNCMHCENIW